MAIVYTHSRLLDGQVFYVGIGKNLKRAYSKFGRSSFWGDYTNKYEYTVTILHEDITWEEACEKEKELISKYGRRDLGLGFLLNMTDGGDGCFNLSLEARNRISYSHKKRGTTPPSRKGLEGTFLGKKHSEESKDKNRKKTIEKWQLGLLKGHPCSEEVKKKISEYNKNNNIKPPNRKGVVYERVECEYCNKLVGSNCIKPHKKSCKLKKFHE
jgi:hypothetical protein